MDYSNDIQGWISSEELNFLYEIAKEMKDIIEVGSYKGRSTLALTAGCEGTVVAIDHWLGSEGLTMAGNEYDEFLENTKDIDNLTVIVGDSIITSEKLGAVDMIFIDGDHTYEGVKQDIKAWKPKAKKMLCGHDYDLPEVKKAVDEAFKIDDLVGSIWIKKF